MLKATDLVKFGDFKKFIFYGKEKLPSVNVKTPYGDCDLSQINWEYVDMIDGDVFDYGHAISLVWDKPYAEHVACVLDKVMNIDLIASEDDIKLYVHLRVK